MRCLFNRFLMNRSIVRCTSGFFPIEGDKLNRYECTRFIYNFPILHQTYSNPLHKKHIMMCTEVNKNIQSVSQK